MTTGVIMLWLFFSLGIVSLFGRRLAEADFSIPPVALLFFWPIILPIAGLVHSAFWVYDTIDDFLWDHLIP